MLLRDSRLFFRSLGYVIIIGCLLLGGCAAALHMVLASDTGGGKPLTLALVNHDKNEALSELVINVIAGNSNIAAALDVQYYDTDEEAEKAVENGAAAAMIIPERFFASVYYGENLPCRIILNSTNASSAATIRYFTEIGADMLNAAQEAIYEGDLYLIDQGADDNTRSAFNGELNERMVSEAAHAADSYFRIENVGFTAVGLSRIGHYAAVLIGFFFGLLSLCLFHLYHDDTSHDMLIRLSSAGVTKKRYLLWKILLPAALFAIILVIAILAGGKFIVLNITPAAVICAMLAALFAAAFCGLFGVALGNLSGPVLFAVFFVSMFFCGGIIPYSNLSETALFIGKLTPLGVIYQLLSPVLGGTAEPWTAAVGAVYIALGILAVNRSLNRVMLGKETL